MEGERRLGKRRNEPQVHLKAFVATPAYNGRVDTDYAVSIAESCLAASHMGIGVHAGVMGNGAFIEMSRNQFVTLFLESDCTHLFFIDSDLKWEARAFVGTILACTPDKPVLAGAYRKREDVESYPIRYWETPENPGITIEHGGFVKCDRAATGFLCIRREIIETMAREAEVYEIPQWGWAPRLFATDDVPMRVKDPKAKCPAWADPAKFDARMLFMGEDFFWCDSFRRRFPEHFIWVWPDFDFKHGGRPCNWHKFIARQTEEYAETMKKAQADAAHMAGIEVADAATSTAEAA